MQFLEFLIHISLLVKESLLQGVTHFVQILNGFLPLQVKQVVHKIDRPADGVFVELFFIIRLIAFGHIGHPGIHGHVCAGERVIDIEPVDSAHFIGQPPPQLSHHTVFSTGPGHITSPVNFQ